MFRYILPLNKKAKFMMKNESSVEWTQNYPKEKDLRFWKMVAKGKYVEVSMPEFNYETIEYNKRNIKINSSGTTLDSFFI